MVIHVNIDSLCPSANLLQSNLAPKKYVVVKNHVREINKSIDNTPLEKTDNKEVTEEKIKTRKCKSKTLNVQPLQYTEDNNQNSVASSQYVEDIDQNLDTCEVTNSDLQELRQVYTQCKSVINKIETKYGHLLNLPNETLNNEEECKRRQNKNIVFNEYGRQYFKDSTYKKYICVNKLRPYERRLPVRKGNLKIEYTTNNYSDLPDSLIDLGNILKEHIDFRLRRFVINKIKELRQNYTTQVKENKRLLVKKLKENPLEDLLGFEGTNLSTISGYPN